jgi:flagellar basal body P-ring formation protein FlgA
MRSSADLRARAGRLAAAALLLLGLATGARAAEEGRITVARDALVHDDVIRLGEIATLEGRATERLADLDLGPAPGAGEGRTIAGRAVLWALRREGVDLDAVTYTIPAAVRVRRATQDLGEPEVRRAIEAFLDETLGHDRDAAVVRAVEAPTPIRIPAGPWTARVIAPAGAPLLGRIRLQIELSVNDRAVKTVWATTDIGVFGETVVARRPIARGETLGAADVEVERRDLSRVRRGGVVSLDEVVGQIARVPITPFVPLRRDQIGAPTVVHPGDVVLLVVERGALRITVPGEVRGEAGVGEQVRVVNRTTHKDLVGRVVDPSTVAVDF